MSGIRVADIPDVRKIYELACELLEKSAYNGIKMDEQKFKLTVAGLIGSKLGRVYVVVDDQDEPQGFFLGVIDELFYSRERYGTDLAVYVRDGFLRFAPRLYKLFMAWAFSKPRVAEVSFAQSSGMGDPDRFDRLMKHIGFPCRIGGLYMKRAN